MNEFPLSALLRITPNMSNPFPRKGLCYLVKDTLYIALTNRSPATSLIASRGPGFLFAKSFVRLDDDEIPDEPESGEIIAAIRNARLLMPDWNGNSIVFAGAGEPLLRSQQMFAVTTALNTSTDPFDFRVNTCGLFDPDIAIGLKTCGIRKVSIALNAHDKESYQLIMHPPAGRNFEDVLVFLKACVEQNLEVEATCIDRRNIIDLYRARRIAGNLGATFRLREYFS